MSSIGIEPLNAKPDTDGRLRDHFHFARPESMLRDYHQHIVLSSDY
jgi:hypothetical protein